MDEGQRFLRYAIPGIAVAVVFVLALIVAHSGAIFSLGEFSISWQAIGLVLGGVLATGGVGFIFAQIYFGLPAWFNMADYRDTVIDFREVAGEVLLCYRGRKGRQEARIFASNTFLSCMGKKNGSKALIESTNRKAKRMASLGTTVTGIAILLPIWFLVVCKFLPNEFSNLPCPSLGGLAGGLACFVLPGTFMLSAWLKIREDLERTMAYVLPRCMRDYNESKPAPRQGKGAPDPLP